MATPRFPPCPPILKPIQHYLKTAVEHDNRDPVISYWCRLYSLQTGLKIDRKQKESLALLSALMDWLEMQKKDLADNEAVTNDLAAQAHVENYALKLFLWADGEDRDSRFNKNVVKAFYTSGMLFDVLTSFGELSEEVEAHRKYAKWKAAYIHNCLKNGETPIPGPMPEEEDDLQMVVPQEFGGNDEGASSSAEGMDPPPPSMGFSGGGPPMNFGGGPSMNFGGGPSLNFGGGTSSDLVLPTPPRDPSPTPSFGHNPYLSAFKDNPAVFTHPQPSANVDYTTSDYSHLAPTGGVALKPEHIAKAQKYCKWASSALNYEDVPTAIENLQKATRLLQTGQDT